MHLCVDVDFMGHAYRLSWTCRFGLNPLWLWGAIQSYIRLRNKERVAKTEAEARTAKEEVSVNVSNEVVAPLKVEKNIDRTTRAKSVLHTHGDGLAKRRRVFAAVATADSEFTVKE